MAYDARLFKIPQVAAITMQRVFNHLTSQGRAGSGGLWTRTRARDIEPVAFGTYVLTTLLNRKAPDVMDVIADRNGDEVPMPPGWSRVTAPKGYPDEHVLTLDDISLTATHMSFYSVPNVQPVVRLYELNHRLAMRKPKDTLPLLDLPLLGAEQVGYDGNEQRTPLFSDRFALNLKHMVVTVEREESYTDTALLKAEWARANELAKSLGFKGAARIGSKKVA